MFGRVLVLVLAGLLIFFRALLSGFGLVEMFDPMGIQTQQAIHELVEGADPRNLGGSEATDNRVERVGTHLGDPGINGRDATQQHGDE